MRCKHRELAACTFEETGMEIIYACIQDMDVCVYVFIKKKNVCVYFVSLTGLCTMEPMISGVLSDMVSVQKHASCPLSQQMILGLISIYIRSIIISIIILWTLKKEMLQVEAREI